MQSWRWIDNSEDERLADDRSTSADWPHRIRARSANCLCGCSAPHRLGRRVAADTLIFDRDDDGSAGRPLSSPSRRCPVPSLYCPSVRRQQLLAAPLDSAAINGMILSAPAPARKPKSTSSISHEFLRNRCRRTDCPHTSLYICRHMLQPYSTA